MKRTPPSYSRKMARSRARKAHRRKSGRRRPRQRAMIFGSHNYVLITVGIVAVVIGYAIMRLENEVDGMISLYIAPLLILGGYLEIIYAILWQPRQS